MEIQIGMMEKSNPRLATQTGVSLEETKKRNQLKHAEQSFFSAA